MSRRTIWIIVSVAVAAIVIAGGIVWYNAKAYDDTVASCKKALVEQDEAGGEGKPEACEGVKEKDYSALVLMAAIEGMPKEQRDTFDYFDDGSINDSIG